MLEYAVEDVLEQATIGSEKHMLEYSVDNVLEQTDIGSNSNTEVTGSDSVAQSAEAESVIRNITSGHMEVYEKQLIDRDNVDESLKLIPELLDKLMESETEIDNQETDDQAIADFNSIEKLYDGLIKQEIDLESACANSVFQRVEDRLQMSKNDLAKSRTAKLWLLYLEMISVLKQFIKAEREGNWDLHLHSMSRMLPFFAASGHNLYAKSAYIYLQNMENLSITHPSVHRLFQKGFHVIRRSDRYWAGLSTDLVIEQMLMRSLKTSGGLTRGRGMTEAQRTIWLLSMPACADVSQAMEEFSSTTYVSSEQHKDSKKARISRDNRDMESLAVFLEARNPFDSDQSLRSISSGVIADEAVNVDVAKQVGESILKSMEGKHVEEFVFRKKAQAVTLNCKSQLKIDGDMVTVDPYLLFQRLISAARGNTDQKELEDFFTYELATHPATLFRMDTLIRAATKPQIATAIWGHFKLSSALIQGESKYVLDGGALLQHIPWPRGVTYDNIYDLYVKYVTHKYGPSSVVVFDGYSDMPSTKDTAHIRRSKSQIGNTINFSSDMTLDMKKDLFLANTQNKQRFIVSLREKFAEHKIRTLQAEGDADLLIVQTAVECAEKDQTVLVGEDTDLLILLCHYASIDANNIYFKPEKRRNMKTAPKVWDIKETKLKLGNELCDNILFVHAILGCDTTSSVFGLGKGSALKKYLNEDKFRECATVFSTGEGVSVEDVIKYGEIAMVILFGGEAKEKLDKLRLDIFYQKVASSVTFVKPEHLPPTSAATRYHSLRTYHQIQVWKGRNDLPAQNWGWAVKGNRLLAVHTDRPPAPERFLKVVRCKCKTDCKTSRCTCRKHGLTCSQMCGECKGVSCLNPEQVENIDINGDDE